jgi:hypothetical protein
MAPNRADLRGGRAKLSRPMAILEWTARPALEVVPALCGSYPAEDRLSVDQLGLTRRAGEGRRRGVRLAGESSSSLYHGSLEEHPVSRSRVTGVCQVSDEKGKCCGTRLLATEQTAARVAGTISCSSHRFRDYRLPCPG